MNTPDQDTVFRALEDARRILGEYITPGQGDAMQTVERLLAGAESSSLSTDVFPSPEAALG